MQGWRPIDAEGNAEDFTWISYEQARESFTAIGSAIKHLDLAPVVSDGDRNVSFNKWVQQCQHSI